MDRDVEIGLIVETGATFHGTQRGWTEIQTIAQTAEGTGFDSLWVYDHPLRREAWGTLATWECFSVLAALAAVTHQIKLGVQVAKLGFRNPALLAKQAETVDEISAGRLVLGLGWGAPESESLTFGIPTDRPFSRFNEAFSIVHALLKTGSADLRGEFYDIRDCELVPRGPRPQGVPLMVGVKGPKMMQLAVRHADLIDCLQLDRKEAVAWVKQTCAQVGRDPSTIALVDTLWIRADDDQTEWSIRLDEVRETIEESVELGYSHVILWPEPNNLASIAALCDADLSF